MNTQQFHDCTHKIYASLSKTKIQALKWEVGIKSLAKELLVIDNSCWGRESYHFLRVLSENSNMLQWMATHIRDYRY